MKGLDAMGKPGVCACRVLDMGLIEYGQAYQVQQQCVSQVEREGRSFLLLCEHLPVLTTGRLADPTNILSSAEGLHAQGIRVYPMDRGGDVTLHAPGQLVVYPILDLRYYKKDLRMYLHQLEQVAIDLLKCFDIVANRFSGRTGVWAQGKKIVSVGIGVRRWISYHGLALNVNTDLNFFSLIKPCGLEAQMTSMAALKGREFSMDEVKQHLVQCFSDNFCLDCLKE